jgi:colanic acid/amylovoran biosynthesis protein
MGVWALASGAVTSIWHAQANARIDLLDYNASPENYNVKHRGGTVDVQLLNLRFSKKFWLPNNIARLLLTAMLIRCIPSRALQEKLFARNYIFGQIQNSDIVGSIAGGDSFSDNYGLGRLIYVALPQVLALLLRNPLILLPQTIGPFNGLAGKMIARFILSRAEKVYSRDRESLTVARQLVGGDNGKTAFCYDMGFVLEPRIEERRIPAWFAGNDLAISRVGINVSGLLYMGGYTRDNMFGLKGDYPTVVQGLIRHLVIQRKAEVVLFPHVFGEGENSENDLTACREVFQEAEDKVKEKLHVIEDGYDHHEIKALIGRCDFFLGSRMHACIGALSQCIPAVGLAYSRKFRGVYETVGMEELVIDLREHDEAAVIGLVDRAYERREEFRKKLEAVMPEVREAALSLFADERLSESKE